MTDEKNIGPSVAEIMKMEQDFLTLLGDHFLKQKVLPGTAIALLASALGKSMHAHALPGELDATLDLTFKAIKAYAHGEEYGGEVIHH